MALLPMYGCAKCATVYTVYGMFCKFSEFRVRRPLTALGPQSLKRHWTPRGPLRLGAKHIFFWGQEKAVQEVKGKWPYKLKRIWYFAIWRPAFYPVLGALGQPWQTLSCSFSLAFSLPGHNSPQLVCMNRRNASGWKRLTALGRLDVVLWQRQIKRLRWSARVGHQSRPFQPNQKREVTTRVWWE